MRPTLRLAVVVAAALSAGCAYFAPTPTLMPGSAKEQVTNDLPVPQGFELVRDRTWRHERSAYRRLRLTYKRNDYLAKERVVEFVQTNFPKHGWKVKFVYGLETPQLLLHKNGEECRLTILEDFGDAFTEFTIEVEPRLTPDGGLVASEPRIAVPPPIPASFPSVSEMNPAASDTAPVGSEAE
jgi:hypothetical protein